MANLLTISRIILSPLLLLLPPLSPFFFALYLSLALTDMLDGFVARKTGTASVFGERLDSISDLIFFLFAAIVLVPRLQISLPLYILVSFVFLLRVGNMVFSYAKRKRIILLHTALNKATGLLIFIFPFTMNYIDQNITVSLLSLLALISSLEETYLIGRVKG